MTKKTPLRPADDEARKIARDLLDAATFGALAVTLPTDQTPFVSRIAVGRAPDGTPVSLVSDLSQHTAALRANPVCSLMVGEPGPKGDPLTHARLTLQCSTAFVAHQDEAFRPLRDHYLSDHPKAKLYIDFADFSFVLFAVMRGFLNGGFGFACMLTPADLGLEGIEFPRPAP